MEKHAFTCEYLFVNAFPAFRLYSFLIWICLVLIHKLMGPLAPCCTLKREQMAERGTTIPLPLYCCIRILELSPDMYISEHSGHEWGCL